MWWGFSVHGQSAPLTAVRVCTCFPSKHTERKGRREPVHGYELLFLGSCKFDVETPFSQALGQSKPRGDDLRHPRSWKGGHSLLFTTVSFYHWAFMSKFPQGTFPHWLRKRQFNVLHDQGWDYLSWFSSFPRIQCVSSASQKGKYSSSSVSSAGTSLDSSDSPVLNQINGLL